MWRSSCGWRWKAPFPDNLGRQGLIRVWCEASARGCEAVFPRIGEHEGQDMHGRPSVAIARARGYSANEDLPRDGPNLAAAFRRERNIDHGLRHSRARKAELQKREPVLRIGAKADRKRPDADQCAAGRYCRPSQQVRCIGSSDKLSAERRQFGSMKNIRLVLRFEQLDPERPDFRQVFRARKPTELLATLSANGWRLGQRRRGHKRCLRAC